MSTKKIKEVIYWWFDFLNGKRPHSREDYERLEKVFGPFDGEQSIQDSWQSVQRTCQQMWHYREFDDYLRKSGAFYFYAKRFCRHHECPVSKTFGDRSGSDAASSSDDDGIFNLVVGPNGHLSSGSPKEFVDVIMERLAITGNISEAYYHDPYIVKSLKQGQGQQFAKDFLSELQSRITPLIAVTKEDVGGISSSVGTPLKQIRDRVLHDRLLVAFDDGEWKGVSVGSSINAFPSQISSGEKPHFVITKLENADAPIIANVIKSNLI